MNGENENYSNNNGGNAGRGRGRGTKRRGNNRPPNAPGWFKTIMGWNGAPLPACQKLLVYVLGIVMI